MNFISDTLNTLDVAQRYNLSPDIQMLLAQQTLYLSALIKRKPSQQTTAMTQFAASLDHFVATVTAPANVPEITATPTLDIAITTLTTISIPITNTPMVSQTPQSDVALTGTPTITATLAPAINLTDNLIPQHTPNKKPVHPTQKPLPPQVNPNTTDNIRN